MIIVTGPNGNVGTELIRQLMETDLPFRIAAHTPEKITRRYGSGVNRVKFDFADRSTWATTLDGAKTLFLLFPLPHPQTARSWMVPFVEAAVAAGIEHIVYVSVPGADSRKYVPHNAVETAVRSSGVRYTILQAAFFSQNLSRDITTHAIDIAMYDELFIPAGRGLTSFIDSRDVAEVAVKVMRDPEPHAGQTYLLTGPELLDFHSVATMLSAVTGRTIRYSNPSLPRFVLRMKRRGVSWDVYSFMAIVYTLTRFGKNSPMSGTLETLLGRKPRTMQQYLEDYEAFWRPDSEEIQAMSEGIGKLVTPFSRKFKEGEVR